MFSSQYATEFTESHYGNIKKVVSIRICLLGQFERKTDYDLINVVILCLDNSEGSEKDSILRHLNVLLSGKTKL